MSSLISLLWQSEAKEIPISETLFKTPPAETKHYFFSKKQGRVLRKKHANIEGVVEEHSGLFLVITRPKHRFLKAELAEKT